MWTFTFCQMLLLHFFLTSWEEIEHYCMLHILYLFACGRELFVSSAFLPSPVEKYRNPLWGKDSHSTHSCWRNDFWVLPSIFKVVNVIVTWMETYHKAHHHVYRNSLTYCPSISSMYVSLQAVSIVKGIKFIPLIINSIERQYHEHAFPRF